MSVKTYHTMDRAEFIALSTSLHGKSHFIDLPNGRILMSAAFHDEGCEEHFHSLAKTLNNLPHPIFSGNEPISAAHATELGHLFDTVGNASKGILPEDPTKATVRHIAKKAGAIHPLMKLSVF